MLESGRVLGHRYEIIEEIGSGGMAHVYKAKDNKLGRMVAIKILKQEMALDNTILEKFRKEALAAGSLNHPNIVGVYDLGHELGSDYIVMEYIDGITLKEYIRRRDVLSCEEVLKISIKIADALRAAHQSGIVHRDIKPQNIMVTPQGDVKVTDFGIAKATTSTTVTAKGETLGSVHYLSPEQARGSEVDARTDLYSLGITIYEMATKELPFNAETPVAVAMMQLHDPFPNPQRKAPQIWDGLCDIIIKLTQKKPELRYQNAESLIVDMKRLYRNHNYRISAGVAAKPTHEQKAPDAALLAEQEKMRREAERERILAEREERLREKKRKKNWTIAIASVSAFLVILIIVLTIIIVKKGGQEAEKIGSMPVEETMPESDQSSDARENADEEESANMSEVKTAKDYEGMDYADAQAAIRDLGYPLKMEAVNNEEVEIGHVVNQLPKEGEPIGEEGITLYVSLGPEQELVKVPDLYKMTEKEAEEALKDRGLEVGQVTTSYSSSVEEGCVVSQGALRDSEVISGTSIDFVVSLGESESADMKTKEGQITVYNPFKEEKDSGLLKVIAVDNNGGQQTLYDSNVSYSTFESLGGNLKFNYEAGTILVEVYMNGQLMQSEQISR